jgi:DNA-binding NtrC family response regulator
MKENKLNTGKPGLSISDWLIPPPIKYREDGQNNRKPESSNSRWMVPPGLEHTVADFLKLYELLYKNPVKKTPLMIMGDRGVGKSLFVHVFEKLFTENNKNGKVLRVNVAALTPELIRSELFGHIKGSFTGAIKNKIGLVEIADLLILEEIGEIPQEIQAALLTFLEDRIFYRLGDTAPQKSKKENLTIISTTNKKKRDFRQDFSDRFFRFPIPPLYERRLDVFYHLLYKFPNALMSLRPVDCMVLLTHNWPGNVREVERVGEEIEWAQSTFSLDRYLNEEDALQQRMYTGMDRAELKYFALSEVAFAMRKTQTSLVWDDCLKFDDILRRKGISIKSLDEVLRFYGLGIMGDTQDNPNKSQKAIEWPLFTHEDSSTNDQRFGIMTMPVDENRAIFNFYLGLSLYCWLFQISPNHNDSLFHVKEAGGSSFSYNDYLDKRVLIENGITNRRLFIDCIAYATGIVPQENHKDNMDEYFLYVDRILRSRSQNPTQPTRYFHAEDEQISFPQSEEPQIPDLTIMTEKQLLKNYYAQVMAKTCGNFRDAAKITGVKEDTLRKRKKNPHQ